MPGRRRTNPESIMDIGDGGLNRFGEGLFTDGTEELIPDGYYGKSYNNGQDVIKNPTLLQKSLKLGVDNG